MGSVDNMPRLNYTPGSATSCPSLLLEPQRTNLFTNSEYFNSGTWSIQTATITDNAAISPEGVQTASLYTTSSDLYDFVRQSVSFVSGTTYTYSVFAKVGTSSEITLLFNSSAFGTTQSAEFNLNDGTYVIFSGTPTAIIEDYGDGWYRCILSATATATASYPTGFSSTAVGNVSTLYLYGAQMEVGSYATSYIPTFGATVTRVADSGLGLGSASMFSVSNGVLFAKISALANDLTFRQFGLAGTSGNEVNLSYDSVSNRIGAIVRSSGTYYVLSHVVTDTTQNIKIALKYKLNDVKLFINGVQVASTTTANMPANLSEFNFAIGTTNANKFFGNVRKILYFPTNLSDTQLAELTSIDS